MYFGRNQKAIDGRLESQNIKSESPERFTWALYRARIQKNLWGEGLVALE